MALMLAATESPQLTHSWLVHTSDSFAFFAAIPNDSSYDELLHLKPSRTYWYESVQPSRYAESRNLRNEWGVDIAV
jgi:hypothetical protein